MREKTLKNLRPFLGGQAVYSVYTLYTAVSYTHLRAHETVLDLVCRLLLEKKNKRKKSIAARTQQPRRCNIRSLTNNNEHTRAK